jgi:hypothetical protein
MIDWIGTTTMAMATRYRENPVWNADATNADVCKEVMNRLSKSPADGASDKNTPIFGELTIGSLKAIAKRLKLLILLPLRLLPNL